MISQSAGFTRRKRPSTDLIAMPIGASSKAERKRSSASRSASSERRRSVMSSICETK